MESEKLSHALTVVRQLAALPAPEAAFGIEQARTALRTSTDPALVRELSHSLPQSVRTLPGEVSLALAELASDLAPYRPRLPHDILDLEPRLRVVWGRAALSCGHAAFIDRIEDPALLAIVSGFALGKLPAASRLFARLASAGEARLREALLGALKPAVEHLALAPEEAFDLLLPITADAEPRLRIAAFELLPQSWLARLTANRRRRRDDRIAEAITESELPVAKAALAAAGDLGLREVLAAVAEVERHPAALRADAIARLGPFADAADLDFVLSTVSVDPLRFGSPARQFVLEAHRHGVFVRESHLADLLAAFDAHTAWTGEELVRVAHIARAPLVRMLEDLDADDPRWRRRASIVAASSVPGAHEIIRRKLAQVGDLTTATAFIEAAGRCVDFADEGLLLAWLDRAPEAVLRVLRAKGTEAGTSRVDTFIRDDFTPPALRALAMDVCWAHARDRAALLAGWTEALGPRDGGLLDGKYVVRRDAEAARLLRAQTISNTRGETAVAPLDALRVFCESGDLDFLPEVTRLFREVFRHYVALALAGDFTVKRIRMPELEQLVFRFGRHVVKDGRVVRPWLDDGPETGRDLVLSLVCDWLRESPSEAILVALLETASRHAPTGAWLRAIESFWRHGGPNVRRAAIEAILGAGDGARGLELSLCRLAESSDPRILCQALAAARTLRASWAEPLVRRALERPEMSVKKEAADALAEVGNPSSIPALVRWLAHHDNQSFRASLLKACTNLAGPSFVAVIVEALDGELEPEPRERDLLMATLSGHITLAAVARLAQSPRPARAAVVDACVDGRIDVVGTTQDDVAAFLHRARLREAPVVADPAVALRTLGFSSERARALVAARDRGPGDVVLADARFLPVVRQQLADWVGWLLESHEPHAADLVLDAAERGHAELFDRLLDLALRASTTIDQASIAGFFERALLGATRPQKIRAIAILRSLAPLSALSGRRRYRLLGSLGAVRTAADLDVCLAACRVGPDFAIESAGLLMDAFAIPPSVKNEPKALTALREEALAYFRAEKGAAATWLARTLSVRPLDVAPAPPPIAPLERAPFVADSEAALRYLLTTLGEGAPEERQRASTRLLSWDDAHEAWDVVLASFLRGEVAVDPVHRARIASRLTSWPTGSESPRALDLAPHLTAAQVRTFLPTWIEGWERGSEEADAALRAIAQDHLLAWVHERARSGDFRPARLLVRAESPAIRAIVKLATPATFRDVEHLVLRKLDTPSAGAGETDPIDPIASMSLEALVALIETRTTERGLAVRAIHALGRHGERAAPSLESFAVDRRAEVRSAALRVLRTVTSKDETLRVTAKALAIETRTDVTLSLMASLGHGRYESALPLLVEHLSHANVRLRNGAREALRAWGRDVIPALRGAARRARPDRRARIVALIAELEG